MKAAGVDYEVIEYPGAMHTFTNGALQKFLQGLFAGP